MLARLTGVLTAMLLLSACAAPAAAPSPSAAPTASPSPTVAPLAVITIISPKSTDTPAAGSIVVTFDVAKVVLVPAASAQKPEDYHVHAAMDLDTSQWIGKSLPVPAGAANTTPDRLFHTAANTVTFQNVAAGQHTVTVWLSFSTHVSVVPPVFASVTFTVK